MSQAPRNHYAGGIWKRNNYESFFISSFRDGLVRTVGLTLPSSCTVFSQAFAVKLISVTYPRRTGQSSLDNNRVRMRLDQEQNACCWLYSWSFVVFYVEKKPKELMTWSTLLSSQPCYPINNSVGEDAADCRNSLEWNRKSFSKFASVSVSAISQVCRSCERATSLKLTVRKLLCLVIIQACTSTTIQGTNFIKFRMLSGCDL